MPASNVRNLIRDWYVDLRARNSYNDGQKAAISALNSVNHRTDESDLIAKLRQNTKCSSSSNSDPSDEGYLSCITYERPTGILRADQHTALFAPHHEFQTRLPNDFIAKLHQHVPRGTNIPGGRTEVSRKHGKKKNSISHEKSGYATRTRFTALENV